jgi:hypothetical protein
MMAPRTLYDDGGSRPPFGSKRTSARTRQPRQLSFRLGMKTVSEFFGIPKTDFEIFSIGFIGNGIFRKRNRFSEFSIGIGIGIGMVFYRPFPSVTGFCRKLPDLCLGIFRNCVSKFFGIVSRNFSACDFSHRLYVSR